MTELLHCIATVRPIPTVDSIKWGLQLDDDHKTIHHQVAWWFIGVAQSIEHFKYEIKNPCQINYVWLRSAIGLAMYREGCENLNQLLLDTERIEDAHVKMKLGKLYYSMEKI